MLDLFGDDDSASVVFRDMILLLFSGVVVCVILILAHINPLAQEVTTAVSQPGNVITEISWPPELDDDVDLWVQAPGDAPVGYSNKGGKFFNLLRDDLGFQNDVSGINYEVSYSRGLPVGEYTVNIHFYRNRAGVLPVPVTAVVSVKNTPADPPRQILAAKVALMREGEELTIFRFRLTDKGSVVPGSVTNLHRGLRTWQDKAL
jgi:hypothetical protein